MPSPQSCESSKSQSKGRCRPLRRHTGARRRTHHHVHTTLTNAHTNTTHTTVAQGTKHPGSPQTVAPVHHRKTYGALHRTRPVVASAALWTKVSPIKFRVPQICISVQNTLLKGWFGLSFKERRKVVCSQNKHYIQAQSWVPAGSFD